MDDNKDSGDEAYNKDTLDLSRSCLKKIPKVEDAQTIRTLILDENELQKIENIDAYLKIEKLSLNKNQLLRMYGISRLTCLRELDISYNGILTIEGLKELQNLRHLNLEGNNIKTIEHLNTNTVLETLNLSENSILQIGDISFLKCLKELYLHGNRISHLRQCDKYLPTSLEVLSLKRNNLTDLNELCTLSHLCNLNHVAIADNPCVQMTGNAVGFDYRPFVLNWIMSVKIIDGYVVNPIESLKAEWLYSQGRGRQFRVGEQGALASYLATVCPFSGEALENENERKLRLILSKAQQHQRQLQEQITNSDNSSTNNSPSLLRKKGPSTRIQSPRFSRLSGGGRHNSPDKMSSSYHGNVSNSSMTSSITESTAPSNSNQLLEMTNSLIENFTSDIMTQSLDPTILSGNSTSAATQPIRDMNNSYSKQQQLSRNNLTNFYNDQAAHQMCSGPLTAASKMVPVPESLMSPDCCPAAVVQRVGVAVCGTTANLTATTPQIPQPVKTRDNRLQTQPVNGNGSRKSPKAMKRIEKPSVINSRKFSNNTSPRAQSFKAQNHFSDASTVGNSTSDDDSDSVNLDKLKTIRNKAAQQKNQKQKDNNNVLEQQQIAQPVAVNKTTENSAILIQKIWRGFCARKQNAHIAEVLQRKRTQDYIIKLTQDMEMTKAALENERKIQQLQMQAINALWKKVTALQTTNDGGGDAASSAAKEVDGPATDVGFNLTSNQTDSVAVVQDLTKTCSLLMNQVQQLQVSMRDIITFMSAVANIPPPPPSEPKNNEHNTKDSCETQTEIVAVHTPQVEDLPTFPFTKVGGKLMATGRPLSLPIMHSKDRDDETVAEEADDVHKDLKEDEIDQQLGSSDTNDVVV